MKKSLFISVFFVVLVGFSNGISAQINREPISISQKTDDGILVAYPNPAKDYIFVKSKDASVKIKSISFYTILGTQVANFTINANSSEINIDRLRPGKYLMRYVLSDDTQKVTQIIKQ
jgi:hypothetical protein